MSLVQDRGICASHREGHLGHSSRQKPTSYALSRAPDAELALLKKSAVVDCSLSEELVVEMVRNMSADEADPIYIDSPCNLAFLICTFCQAVYQHIGTVFSAPVRICYVCTLSEQGHDTDEQCH
jgi:hypothetical protein